MCGKEISDWKASKVTSRGVTPINFLATSINDVDTVYAQHINLVRIIFTCFFGFGHGLIRTLQINPLRSLTNWVDSTKWFNSELEFSHPALPKMPLVCFFLSAAVKNDGSKDKPGSFPRHLNLLPNWTERNGSCTWKASWGTGFGHHTCSCFQLDSLSNALK